MDNLARDKILAKLADKASDSHKRKVIDSAFVLRILLEYYRIEKR